MFIIFNAQSYHNGVRQMLSSGQGRCSVLVPLHPKKYHSCGFYLSGVLYNIKCIFVLAILSGGLFKGITYNVVSQTMAIIYKIWRFSL